MKQDSSCSGSDSGQITKVLREGNEEVGIAVAEDAVNRLTGLSQAHLGSVHATLREKQCWQSFIIAVGTAVVGLVLLVVCLWRSSAASARDPVTGNIREHTFQYFVLCFIGGGFAGMAHILVTPLDVVKCRMQVGEYTSVTQGFRQIFADAKGSCARALPTLFRGWVPILYAYVIQGALKFSLYELFKYLTALATGAGPHSSGLQKLATYLISSSVAEVFADLGLAPFEAVKIKMQTTNLHPTGMAAILQRIWASEGLQGFYKGLVPLWCRQVPYTMMKFASFEGIVRALSSLLLTDSGQPPSPATELAVTMLAGVLSGFLCALVSHPADTIVSKLNQRGKQATGVEAAVIGALSSAITTGKASMEADTAAIQHEGSEVAADAAAGAPLMAGYAKSGVDLSSSGSVMALVRELGWSGLWRGLVARMGMVGALTSLQWVMYDAFKVAVGLPTMGGGGGGSAARAK